MGQEPTFPSLIEPLFALTAQEIIGDLLRVPKDPAVIEFEWVRIILGFIPGHAINAGR